MFCSSFPSMVLAHEDFTLFGALNQL